MRPLGGGGGGGRAGSCATVPSVFDSPCILHDRANEGLQAPQVGMAHASGRC